MTASHRCTDGTPFPTASAAAPGAHRLWECGEADNGAVRMYTLCSMEPGALLREARRRSRLSQHEVAARAGCSQSAVALVEAGKRDPSPALLERLLAACGFQLHAELEPLDTTLDQQIEAMAVMEGPTSHYLLSQNLLFLAPRLAEAAVPFVVDGVAAAILYDLRDPDAHWLADSVQIRVRTQATDPCAGAVSLTVRGYKEEATVSVVPLQQIILPRRYARALERMRQRLADLAIGPRQPLELNGERSTCRGPQATFRGQKPRRRRHKSGS